MRVSVESVEQRDGHWLVTQTHTEDNGTSTRHVHAFPLDTLEWRVAEYGIDPADVDTLLDVVLTEGHLTPQDWEDGHQLHNAPDIATARADHLARCAKAKLRHRISTRGAAGNALQRIRDESPLHHEVVKVKREHVEQVRRHVQEQLQAAAAAAPAALSAPAPTPSGAERAAELRQKLGLDGVKKADPRGGGRR